ncbi:MAG: FAD-dependent oxidoreductase, partial [Burkholderiales bacterium]
DGVLDLERLPRHAVLIGAGYIGVEFACILRSLGAEVTLVFRSDAPLRGFDEDLRQRVHRAMAAQGITMRGAVHPAAIGHSADGYTVTLDDGSEIGCELVVNATGRHPNSDHIGLDRLGIEPGPHGEIRVDEFSATSVPDVFAVGDVTNRANLTPVAIAEARAMADSEFGGARRPFHHDNIATAVFSTPPIGTVGLTEHEAAQRCRVRVYETEFRPMRTAFAGGEQRIYMKLLVDDESDRVLGVHMLGDDAPEIVQSLAVAVVAGATKAHFDRTVAVHPTAAEEFVLMREAARVVG